MIRKKVYRLVQQAGLFTTFGGWVSLFVIDRKLSLDMGAERIASDGGGLGS